MDNEVKEFEEQFQTEEMELIVLIQSNVGGAAVRGNYLTPSANFLAYIDGRTGEFIQEKGRLQWIFKRKSGKEDWGFDLKGLCAYRVLVRKCIPQNDTNNTFWAVNERYLLVKILEDDVKDSRLDQVKETYLKPMYIEDKIGHFQLDREYDWYEGTINWCKKECDVMLNLDEGKETADRALKALKQLTDHMEEWDEKLRAYAAEELTDLANDWRMDMEDYDDEEDEYEEDETGEITEEQFATRLTPNELSIDETGDFEFSFLDDDMFLGHWVVVYGNVNGKLREANMEG